MTNNSLNLAAAYLKSKLAAEQAELDPAALEAAAGVPTQPPVDGGAPAPEGMPPEAMEQGGPEMAAGGEIGEDEIDQLLSQLSPEELEQLAAELAADMQGGGEAGLPGAEVAPNDDEVAQLAQAIQGNLSENPEAQLPEGAPEEKMAALNFVKSAEYIEGFLCRAVSRGVNIKQAVDLYDQALCQTLSDLTHSNNTSAKKVAGLQDNDEVDEKTAAYYEGVLERAREYGFSDQETMNIVKSAGRAPRTMKGSKPAPKPKAPAAAPAKEKSYVEEKANWLRGKVKKNPLAYVGGALATGVVGGGTAAALASDDK